MLLLLGVMAASAAPAEEPARPQNPFRKQTMSLAPHDRHEECFHLGEGDSVDYRFKSTSTVFFDLHYHDEIKVYEPIRKEDTYAESGSYIAPVKQGHCLMWVNTREDVLGLTYEFRINRKHVSE
jgi:hypothetical protein